MWRGSPSLRQAIAYLEGNALPPDGWMLVYRTRRDCPPHRMSDDPVRTSDGSPISVRVLIMDDQHLARAGLCRLFDGSDVAVCAEVATLTELYDQLERDRPSVVLGEIQLGEVSIIEHVGPLRQKYPEL